MASIRTIGLSLAAFMTSTALVHAQSGTAPPTPDPALLKQIEDLQKQLDALKAQAGISSAASVNQPDVSAPGPKADGSAGSTIKMAEGWVARTHLQQAEDFLGAKRPILNELPEEPLNAFIVKEASFPLSALSEGSRSLPQGKAYGYTLQGYFRAEKEGKYGFGVEAVASVPEGGVEFGSSKWTGANCFTSLKIEGRTVFQETGSLGRENKSFKSIAMAGSVSLSPGIYQVEATITCNPQAYQKAFGAIWSLKVRHPDAMEPTVPKAGFLMHKLAQS